MGEPQPQRSTRAQLNRDEGAIVSELRIWALPGVQVADEVGEEGRRSSAVVFRI
jgi:hypothetical protein